VRILLKRQERISLRRPYVGALRPLPSDHPRDYHFHPRRLLPAARYHARQWRPVQPYSRSTAREV